MVVLCFAVTVYFALTMVVLCFAVTVYFALTMVVLCFAVTVYFALTTDLYVYESKSWIVWFIKMN